MTGELDGCTVVVTREQRGELGRLLVQHGASVVHVPLIRIVDADTDDDFARAWSADPQWVVVTSAAGADRVADAVNEHPTVRLAAVGTATAQRITELTGRSVDVVPRRQLAEALVEEFARVVDSPQRILVAQADRAGSVLVDGLVAAGHDVTAVVAYRTLLRPAEPSEIAAIERADAVVFASGSAALAWSAALGDVATDRLPRLVVAIGPTTARAAEESGLKITHVATDHSLAGIVDELIRAWARPG